MPLPRPDRRSLLIYGSYATAFVITAALRTAGAPPLAVFAAATVALAAGALAVGEATERLSARMSPGATGLVQSLLGNLPELFLAIFALQAGLVSVVAAALVGSVLGNALFVLGLALLAGGLRNGVQRFEGEANRLLATLLLLGAAALVVPFLATMPSEPDAGHAQELSVVVSVILLALFLLSVPLSLRLQAPGPGARPAEHESAAGSDDSGAQPPLLPTLVLLGLSGAAAAFVADWFVEALRPAMATLGMSEAFAGLVVVALAGNAVENLVGVKAAWQGRADLSLSLILNSALQVVLFLAPALVLLSLVLAPANPLTLVFDPLLLGMLVVTSLIVLAVVVDGAANAVEGAALVALYAIVAAAVWWGPPIAV